MARYPVDRQDIDATCELWKDNCLINDGSLFDGQRPVWTKANVADLYERFIGSPLIGEEGGGTFMSKWDQQLQNASADLRQLGGELLLIHLLFPSSVSKKRKIEMINETLQHPLDEASTPVRALGQAIGNPGAGFNMRRDLQVGFLITFVKDLKELSTEDRATLLADPWQTQDLAQKAPSENRREMMHIVLHLLHPDSFERIASGSHKREIAKAFASLLQPGDETAVDRSVDQKILDIRHRLEELLPEGNTGTDGAVDFYGPPLRGVWNSQSFDSGEGATDLESLEWKKQLILYGPPGTGKTYSAKVLAEQLISKAALEIWGINQFLHNAKLLEDTLKRNFEKIQLHPGYGYSEFIRGVRLNGNETRYEPGKLVEVVTAMNSRTPTNGLAPLPFVLLLDEINRTDLSAMLGEAFSLLERDKRGDPINLPGINPGEPPAQLALPEDLYVIGTMNEIDQSVETLDFALRRRFLWQECRFDREALLEIIQQRWATDIPSKFTFDQAQPQLETFADNAVSLNKAIAHLDDLGRAYEIGHSYFADITFFLGTWLSGRSKAVSATPLWSGSGQARPPITDLWARSIKPLLEQYLLGTDQTEDAMKQLKHAYLGQ